MVLAQTFSEQDVAMEEDHDHESHVEVPVCTLRVHSVLPVLDVPKVADLSEMPSFLKKRLARRYIDRGEEVPEYLRDDVEAPMEAVMAETVLKAADEYAAKAESEPEAPATPVAAPVAPAATVAPVAPVAPTPPAPKPVAPKPVAAPTPEPPAAPVAPVVPAKPEPVLTKSEYMALKSKRYITQEEFLLYKLGYKEDPVEATPVAAPVAPAATVAPVAPVAPTPPAPKPVAPKPVAAPTPEPPAAPVAPVVPAKPEPVLTKSEYLALKAKRYLSLAEYNIYKLGYKEDPPVEEPVAAPAKPEPTPAPAAPVKEAEPAVPAKPEPVLTKTQYFALKAKRYLTKAEFGLYKLGYKEDPVEAAPAPKPVAAPAKPVAPVAPKPVAPVAPKPVAPVAPTTATKPAAVNPYQQQRPTNYGGYYDRYGRYVRYQQPVARYQQPAQQTTYQQPAQQTTYQQPAQQTTYGQQQAPTQQKYGQ